MSLPYLRDLVDQWQASGEAVGSVLWLQACDLSSHMIGTWPKDWYPRQGDKPTDLARMADSLTRLRDPELIARFLGDVARRGGFDYADIDALLGGFEALPADRARDLVELLVTNATETSLAPCAGLLRRATASTAFSRQGLASATRILVNALPGDPKRRPPEPLWHRRSGVTADTVVDLYAALGSIDEAIAGTAANHMLEWPKIYGIDAVVIPALRRLLELDGVRELIALRCLRDVCVDHLNARIAEPLEPPRDRRRAAAAGCGCPRCIELQRFLADPERESWSLKAAQFERSHIESVIRNAHCDVDTTTVRRGSPHSLICTKNQASYERRVKQRKRDLVDLQQLGAG